MLWLILIGPVKAQPFSYVSTVEWVYLAIPTGVFVLLTLCCLLNQTYKIMEMDKQLKKQDKDLIILSGLRNPIV